MNLFIDTNVFLSFFHFAKDDLEELKKLIVLVSKNKIRLFLPDQVVDEFNRNREVKIAEALKAISNGKLNDQFPQIGRGCEEYENMRAAADTYDRNKVKLLERLQSEIANKTLLADKIISALFERAERIAIDSSILSKSQERLIRGNPPGKNNSSGDGINWEALLHHVPNNEDLYFISGDDDFSSPIDRTELLPFLETEWKVNKESEIFFFNNLSFFFENKFPSIRLARELMKELLISDLESSSSFVSTRKALKDLIKFGDYTDGQLNQIVRAAITNSQILWIITDSDINEYLRKLISGKDHLIDPSAMAELVSLLDQK